MVANHQEKPDQKQPQDLQQLGGDEIIDERNRYYTGKYMTARDFQGEQDYFVSRNRMHNRLLHDWGIVCGLDVSPHPNPACRDRFVVVSPGVAIDCYGREIVLKEKTVVEVWEPVQVSRERLERAEQAAQEVQAAESVAGTEGKGTVGHKRQKHWITEGPFLLLVDYGEEPIEWTPALYAESGCDPRQLEANRVREVACLKVIRWDKDRHAGCWPILEEDKPKERIPCRDDCGDSEGDSPGCLTADCPCEYGVALGLITPWYSRRRGQWTIDEGSIAWEGRRPVRTSPQALTHIVDYNWTHGGVVKYSHLSSPQGMDGKLKVYFDRQLYDPEDERGIGINEHTFVVTYHRQEDGAYPLQILFNDTNPPKIENVDGSCAAVFYIDDDLLSGNVNIGNSILYVTLKCDFILDCHHRPVDGDHLAGRTPTGDGTAGGVFESWFRVEDDRRVQRRDRDRQQQQYRETEES